MEQIKQKAISAKIDNNIFEMMEAYCKRNNMKRNRLINLAIDSYLSENCTE